MLCENCKEKIKISIRSELPQIAIGCQKKHFSSLGVKLMENLGIENAIMKKHRHYSCHLND